MNLKEAYTAINAEGLAIEIDKSTREKLQGLLLNMYKDILRVCQKYQIIPYLGGGSALGAIRHKGFIPWDDDMDINMTREDYLKFREVFQQELSEKYILNAPNYSIESITRFPKVLMKNTVFSLVGAPKQKSFQTVFLDIFIIENVPENRLHQRIKGIYCNLLEFIAGRVESYQNRDDISDKMLRMTGWSSYVFNRAIGRLFSFRTASKWNDTVDKAVQYPKESRLCGFPTGRKHYFGEIHRKDELFPVKYVPFNDIEAPVFENYDHYLTTLYGDYMLIPPEEKREKHFAVKIEL